MGAHGPPLSILFAESARMIDESNSDMALISMATSLLDLGDDLLGLIMEAVFLLVAVNRQWR